MSVVCGGSVPSRTTSMCPFHSSPEAWTCGGGAGGSGGERPAGAGQRAGQGEPAEDGGARFEQATAAHVTAGECGLGFGEGFGCESAMAGAFLVCRDMQRVGGGEHLTGRAHPRE